MGPEQPVRVGNAANHVFVNLPVKDLSRSLAFFGALGFRTEPRFSDERAACVVLGEGKYAMLATEEYFAGFVPGREIADTARCAEVVVALSAKSRAEVDAMADKAASAGGAAYREPMEFGWMYCRAFLDPDGHIWEVLHMDDGRALDHMDDGRASDQTAEAPAPS